MDYYNKIDEAYLTELQNPMRKLKIQGRNSITL